LLLGSGLRPRCLLTLGLEMSEFGGLFCHGGAGAETKNEKANPIHSSFRKNQLNASASIYRPTGDSQFRNISNPTNHQLTAKTPSLPERYAQR